MIVNFKCKETEKIWNVISSKKMPFDIQNTARRKLRMLNNSSVLNDLRVPPNNRLEALSGNRKGQYSIRVNDQYRICFKFENGRASEVEMIDYH